MIAISYRRQDSSPVAGRLYDRLQAEFGKGSVFMDFDSIPYGVDFREHIKTTLQRAKVVVAIIGPEWTGSRDPSNRRIDDPTDFVRLEVASALENGIPIIPVLVNNTPMPEAKSLPAELEGLAFRNGLALDTGIDFHHHADRLIAGIHRVVDPPAVAAPAPQPPPSPTSSSSRKLFPIVAGVGLLAVLSAIAGWYFLIRTPQQVVSQRETTEPARKPEATPVPSTRPEPTIVQAQPPTSATAVPSIPAATSPLPTTPAVASATLSPPAVPAPPPIANEVGREYTYTGKIGMKEATFRLRFEAGERVTGTYSQGAATYRLEGRNPKGKLSLDEYTGERITAHLELTLAESAGVIRWEGTMRNMPPDNRTFPVSFQRSSSSAAAIVAPPSPPPAEASDIVGEYTYSGKVGPYDASFQLRFEPGGRVSGTYTLSTNKNLVLRLEGRNPKGKLFLDEYTREKHTARLELSLNDSASDIRWEGTMYNTPPDNRVFPVSFARPRK